MDKNKTILIIDDVKENIAILDRQLSSAMSENRSLWLH